MNFFTEIHKDIKAHFINAKNPIALTKAIFFNTSIQLLINYRLAKRSARIPVIGGTITHIICYLSQVLTSCHISHRAHIEPGVYFPHPTGIVIGEGVIIKSNVTIYQNVTFGRKDKYSQKYPIINSGATIYCGSVITGAIEIGENCTIAANSVVLKTTPNDSIVGGIPAKQLS